MSPKISDLQGIRGLAIIAALGFHFCPILVPNGYLGVDQFFVLSGFLMCMLLAKSENMPVFSLVLNFYIRRFKRILPLYQLIIFLSLVFLYSCFPEAAISQNEKSAERALLFMSNRLKTDQENYFEMLTNAVDIFTHTWSLSVEIQFYLIVPFIFLLPYKLVSFSIISIISIVYHYSIPSNIAFLNMSTRIWQFKIGMIAFTLRQKTVNTYSPLRTDDCEKQQYSSEKMMLTFTILVTIFFPISFSEEIARPIITGFTGLLLIITSGESSFLSNRLLTYIGDISYSLYLIHWPIYSYWKVTQEDNDEQLIIYLMISIFVSIIIYHTFEQWYTRLSNIQVLILVVILSLSNLAILNHLYLPSLQDKTVTSSGVNKTLEEARRQNTAWNQYDNEHMFYESCVYEGARTPSGWCNHTGLNSSNKYKIMLIGNSWVANHGGIIYEECRGKANTLLQGAAWGEGRALPVGRKEYSLVIVGCEPLYPTPKLATCRRNMGEYVERVKNFEPDYVFHIARHISYGENFTGDFDNDIIYQTMLNQTRKLTKYIKKKMYILDAIPTINNKELPKLIDYMEANMSFVDIDKKLIDFNNFDTARKRYAQLIKDCGSKCEMIYYHNLFYRNDTNSYRFYNDSGFAYITDVLHFTPLGLELIRPIYRGICDKL